MKEIRLRDNPTALTAATVLLWSTGAVLGKLLSEGEGYLSLLLGLGVAAAVILLFRIFFVARPFTIALLRPIPVAAGIVGYGAYWVCYFRCFRNSESAALPVLFNYTWPIFTVVFARLLKTGATSPPKMAAVELAGMLVGLLGIWCAVSSGTESINQGMLYVIGWGLAAGASYGLFSAYSALVSKEDQLDFLLIAIAASSLFLLPFSLDELSGITALSARDLILIALFGVGSEALGSLFWLRANRQARELGIDISAAASLIFTLPLLSLVIISVVFHERTLLRPGFFLGCLLVTACVVICSRAREIAERLGRGPRNVNT